MSGIGLALGILGVWRMTHLLHAENGPGDVVVTLRRAFGTSVFGRAMDCFDCLSLWVAMPFAALVAHAWPDVVLAWPALSAGAMLVHRLVNGLRPPAAALYLEDPPAEAADVQLRQGSHERVADAGSENRNAGATGSPGGIDDRI